ncbi:MAG: ATP-binding protein [Lachnospiraceae bacterium]|nr:ATP-binding protein [Lachnospiraceae bacterium]
MAFCKSKALEGRISLYTGLCIEEIAVNTLDYNSGISREDKEIKVLVFYENHDISLMIRDNYPQMDPMKLLKRYDNSDDPFKGLGLRMVTKVAKNVNYSSALNMNVLTVSNIVCNNSSDTAGGTVRSR